MKTNAQLQKELDDIRAVIPDGYLVAKDTLAESVALMASGLISFANDRQMLRNQVEDLQQELLKIGYQEDDIP